MKQRLLQSVLLAGAIAATLVLCELVLRIRDAHLAAPQQMTSGFLHYDDRLGWRLATNWHGRHQYAGFNVTYATDHTGFRRPPGDPPPAPAPAANLVFGDSFTFGIGVNDDETFVARLNASADSGSRQDPLAARRPPELRRVSLLHVNLGVPGYSTDQEVLLAEQELARRTNASAVLLIVCLANDLLDNARSYPLQAHMAKPQFQIAAGTMALTNVPVPREPKLRGQPGDDLARAMAGPDWQPDWATRRSRQSSLARFVHRELFQLRQPPVGDFPDLPQQQTLFWSLAARLSGICAEKGIALRLALLPGSSAVLYPHSLPGQYQRRLRDDLLPEAARRKIPALDLISPLEQARTLGGAPVFLNDGHLSPRGHAVVAAAIREWDPP